MGGFCKHTAMASSLLICIALFAESVKGGAVPALYVLGDSQADVGNNNVLVASLLKANFPHNGIDYPGHEATGRFSNGKNFVDFLAGSLGLASPQAYHLICNTTGRYSMYPTGVNFASGGAGVSDLTNKGQCFSFGEQIERDYSSVYEELVQQLSKPKALDHLAKSIFAIAIGGNDIINSVLLPITSSPDPQQFIDSLAQTLECQLQRLYELGMRRLFFVGVPPLGCVPLMRNLSPTRECHAEANSLSLEYNRKVASLLQNMSLQHTDFRYSFFNGYPALMQYINEPQAIGFAEVRGACCGLGVDKAMFTCNPASALCRNRTDHMFWILSIRRRSPRGSSLASPSTGLHRLYRQ